MGSPHCFSFGFLVLFMLAFCDEAGDQGLSHSVRNFCLKVGPNLCNFFILTDAVYPTLITLHAKGKCEFYLNETAGVAVSLGSRSTNESNPCEVLGPFNYVILNSVRVFDLNGTSRIYKHTYELLNTSLTHNVSENTSRFLDTHGFFNISVLYSSNANHEDGPPYLLYGIKNLLVSIEISNLVMPNQRSMLELATTIGSSAAEARFTHFSRESFNDYKTPGIFRDENINITGVNYNTSIYWKSVAYTDKSLKQISQISAKMYSMTDTEDVNHVMKMLNFSNNSLRKRMVLSFDVLSPDTYFEETNFTAFYFTIGEGYTVSKHSILPLIVFTGFGLGLPVLSLLFFLFFDWRKPQEFREIPDKPGYSSITCDPSSDSNLVS